MGAGHATQRRSRVRGVRCCEAAVTESRGRADDPRADRADDRVEPAGRCPPEGRGGGHALDVAAEARPGRHGRADQTSCPEHPKGVRERKWERAARYLDVDDASAFERRADRCDLAVQRAADDREAVERLRNRPVFLGVPMLKPVPSNTSVSPTRVGWTTRAMPPSNGQLCCHRILPSAGSKAV